MPDDNSNIFLATGYKEILDNIFQEESVSDSTENTVYAKMTGL